MRQRYTAPMELSLQSLELPVRLRPQHPLSDEELLRFCSVNDLLRIEREPNGDLTIMSPTGTDAGDLDSEINYQLRAWANGNNTGKVFGSSTGFRLPDGSIRSPDASFLSWPKWNALSREETQGFAPVCPEFVIELRSPSDRWNELQGKMVHWIANGAELAWLIDPERQTVEVYRAGDGTPDVLQGVTAVYGEGPVASFVLETAPLWR